MGRVKWSLKNFNLIVLTYSVLNCVLIVLIYSVLNCVCCLKCVVNLGTKYCATKYYRKNIFTTLFLEHSSRIATFFKYIQNTIVKH